jgi:hypothetical protein
MTVRQHHTAQLVRPEHLDAISSIAAASVENARRFTGIAGVLAGLEPVDPAAAPSMVARVAPGQAWFADGSESVVESTQGVPVNVDYLGNSTAVGVGQERIVAVFILYAEAELEVATGTPDGDVPLLLADSYTLRAVAGGSAAAGTASPPATPAGAFRLFEVTIVTGMTDVTGLLVDRRQMALATTSAAGGLSIDAGRVDDAVQQILDLLGEHVVDLGAAHPASAVVFSPVGTPAGWTAVLLAASVQAGIAGVISDLAEEDGGYRVALVPDVTWAQDIEPVADTVGGLVVEIIESLGSDTGGGFVGRSGGGLSADNVGDAIDELAAEKAEAGWNISWTGIQTFTALVEFASATTPRVTATDPSSDPCTVVHQDAVPRRRSRATFSHPNNAAQEVLPNFYTPGGSQRVGMLRYEILAWPDTDETTRSMQEGLVSWGRSGAAIDVDFTIGSSHFEGQLTAMAFIAYSTGGVYGISMTGTTSAGGGAAINYQLILRSLECSDDQT